MADRQDLPIFQSDNKTYIMNKFGTEAWITVYADERTPTENRYVWSALIANDLVEKARQSRDWELHPDEGYPAFWESYQDGEMVVGYSRYGTDEGVLPLVFRRQFHGVKAPYNEILEEFRHLLDLYHDTQRNVYVRIHRDGTEEDIVRVTDKSVMVKLKAIKQFLGAQDLHLALYYDFIRFVPEALSEIGIEASSEFFQKDSVCFTFAVGDLDLSSRSDRKSFSRLVGKKLIAGLPREKSGFYPFDEDVEQHYPAFIIGTDEDGNEVTSTCDPEKLANLFGSNPGAPSYLTPVFFRREVLGKYYADPNRYHVDDGYLSCAGLWSMRIDNNHPTHIVVYLGDLGEYLPESERQHWRAYSDIREGGLSPTTFRRHMLAEFADPVASDLVFKQLYERIQANSQTKFGWPLFLPLDLRDRHYFTALHIPFSNNQKDFDEQVLALVKVLIDSINEKAMEPAIEPLLDHGKPSPKGITKLELYLRSKGVSGYENHIKFLRDLQELRSSGSGHRKGNDYQKVAAAFNPNDKPLNDVFDDILLKAVSLLRFLEATLLMED